MTARLRGQRITILQRWTFLLWLDSGETLPMQSWFAAAQSREALLLNDGSILEGENMGSHEFSSPIFDAVCRWTEEFF